MLANSSSSRRRLKNKLKTQKKKKKILLTKTGHNEYTVSVAAKLKRTLSKYSAEWNQNKMKRRKRKKSAKENENNNRKYIKWKQRTGHWKLPKLCKRTSVLDCRYAFKDETDKVVVGWSDWHWLVKISSKRESLSILNVKFKSKNKK